MNLTDIQVELRDIEEHISHLYSEIEKMKPKTDEDKKAAFDNITKLAEKHPISDLMISSAPKVVQKIFIMSLANLLIIEKTDLYNRLLYIARLSYGCKLKLSAEDIYRAGLEYELKDIEVLCNELVDYKYDYVIEALVVANISGETSNAMISVIVDMAKVFGFDNEQIRVLALVSKSLLIGNADILDEMPVPSKNMWSGRLRDYISTDWIKKRRKKCASICIEQNKKKSDTINNFYLRLMAAIRLTHLKALQGQLVHEGDKILVPASLDSKSNMTKERRTVIAPCDGVLFFVEKKKNGEIKEAQDKYLEAYVVSYFDDYKEFCEWHKNQK